MGIVEIDTGNPELFKVVDFSPPPSGKHTLEVVNDLAVEPVKKAGSQNNKISVDLVVVDEGEGKGRHVWDNFVLITNPQTEKEQKARSINQARLCQFAVACGVKTQEDIEAGEGIPLEEFQGLTCEAITKIETSTDPNTQETRKKAAISRYLFLPPTPPQDVDK